MNSYICDLIVLQKSRTNDRFKARDQGQKELYTNSTVVPQNDDDNVDVDKQPQRDTPSSRAAENKNWNNH